jgi:hypothetical protein
MGRWHCEIAEVESRFVTGLSPLRQKIWEDWKDATKAIQSTTGEVAACWVSGSFVTDTIDPSDIDCVYLIRLDLLAVAMGDVSKAHFLDLVSRSQLKTFGIMVDSYIIPWDPHPGVSPTTQDHWNYLQRRGYWDDFWGRVKDPDPSMEILPRRGYLEVSLDGYR